MKILYGIQGTGNGHISRSREVLKYLCKEAEVDILVSGIHHEVDLGLVNASGAKGARHIGVDLRDDPDRAI